MGPLAFLNLINFSWTNSLIIFILRYVRFTLNHNDDNNRHESVLRISLFARLACSTDSVCVNFFGFTRSTGRPAVPVLTGEVDIVLMTVPKCTKNVQKNVPITLSRERYMSLKKHLANVPELYQKMSQSHYVESVTRA